MSESRAASTRFEEALRAAGIDGVDVRVFPAGTRTAEDAARAVRCHVGQIVWAAAGRPDSVFSITPQRLLDVTAGELVDCVLR